MVADIFVALLGFAVAASGQPATRCTGGRRFFETLDGAAGAEYNGVNNEATWIACKHVREVRFVTFFVY